MLVVIKIFDMFFEHLGMDPSRNDSEHDIGWDHDVMLLGPHHEMQVVQH